MVFFLTICVDILRLCSINLLVRISQHIYITYAISQKMHNINPACKIFPLYSGTSPLGTLWDLDFSPYYRGSLILEVTYVFHYSTYYNGT